MTTNPTGRCHVHGGGDPSLTITPEDLAAAPPPVSSVAPEGADYDPTWLGPKPKREREDTSFTPPEYVEERAKIRAIVEELSERRGMGDSVNEAIRTDEDGSEFGELVIGNEHAASLTSLTHLQLKKDRWEVRRGLGFDAEVGERGVGRLIASGSYGEDFVAKASSAFARGASLGSSPVAVFRRGYRALVGV